MRTPRRLSLAPEPVREERLFRPVGGGIRIKVASVWVLMARALSTDLYQLTMAAGYHLGGEAGWASFELSVRELPPTRGFVVAVGLEQALDFLESARFTHEDIAYLRSVPPLKRVPKSFFEEFLPQFRFRGNVWAMPEGTPVFAKEPILRVTAPVAEAQLVETALLAIVLFQTSVASKAVRVVQAAAGRPVVEFGARRAHGTEAAVLAGRAAYLGGCAATSDVETGRRFGVPLSGTMAHSWVMSHASERHAFDRFAAIYGDEAVFLLDTYDTLEAARKVARSDLRPAAVRLDSGDLAVLSRKVRQTLDAAGLRETQIVASGDLDEHKIAALVGAGAPIDGFGVGTALSTSSDAPALSGVYKMVEIERGGRNQPTAKLSTGKRTHGGCKQVWRVWAGHTADYDVLGTISEPGPPDSSQLLQCVMKAGRRVGDLPSLVQARNTCAEAVGRLPPPVRALSAPDVYRVELSRQLEKLDEGVAGARRW